MKIWLLTGLMLAAALMSPHLDAEETNLEAFIAAQKLELLKRNSPLPRNVICVVYRGL